MPLKKSTGEHKTWKEFFKEVKTGMERVTPLQQTTIIQLGLIISIIGVVWGIIFAIRLAYWWMMVILIGGLIVAGVQFLGNWQKKQILKQIENAYEQSNIEEKEVKENDGKGSADSGYSEPIYQSSPAGK